jgi:hypothetical protein
MSSSKHPLTQTPSERLRSLLQETRQQLVEEGGYMGDRQLMTQNTVVWRRIGRGHCLVTKEWAETTAEAHTRIASQQTEEEENFEEGPDMATLSAVVKITTEDFWMMSCGMWKGPSEMTPSFQDIKLTCTGGIPDDEVFCADYKTVLDNARRLMTEVESNSFDGKRGFLITRGNTHKLKFRHVLFEVRTNSHFTLRAIHTLRISPSTMTTLTLLRKVIYQKTSSSKIGPLLMKPQKMLFVKWLRLTVTK